MSVCLAARIGSATTGLISVKFDIGTFMKICNRISKMKQDKNVGLFYLTTGVGFTVSGGISSP